MDPAKPSLVALLQIVCMDVVRALRAMPHVLVTAFLIVLADTVMRVTIDAAYQRQGASLIALTFSLAFAFLLVPYMIAVHRFVVLGEVTTHYRVEPQLPRIMRYFGSSIILAMLAAVPAAIAGALARSTELETWQVAAIVVAFVIGPMILWLRMTILLPAIAVDAPSASWTNAFHDARGHATGILLVFAVTAALIAVAFVVAAVAWLIVMVFLMVLSKLSVPAPMAAGLGKALMLLTWSAAAVLSATLLAAMTSRLFQLIGKRVNAAA